MVMHLLHGAHVKVSGQLFVVSFLLPPWILGTELKILRFVWQVPLPSELSLELFSFQVVVSKDLRNSTSKIINKPVKEIDLIQVLFNCNKMNKIGDKEISFESIHFHIITFILNITFL